MTKNFQEPWVYPATGPQGRVRLLSWLHMNQLVAILHASMALVCATGLCAQSGSVRPVPGWQLGDRRSVEVRTETLVTVDTIQLGTTMDASYTLEVVAARKDGYELAVRSGELSAPTIRMDAIGTAALDSVNQLLAEYGQAMSAPLAAFAFRYRVDRAGTVLGLIAGRDDRRKLTAAMGRSAEQYMAALAQVEGEPPPSVDAAALLHVMDSLYDTFLEVQLNGMNYFLKIYATEFPLTGSLRQPVLVEDLQAPLHTEFPRIPGVLEAGLDKNDAQELVGRTITTYDPDALFAYMRDQHGVTLDQREGLYMNEECVERFDKRTGWLTASTTATRLGAGPLKMSMKVTTRLKTINP